VSGIDICDVKSEFGFEFRSIEHANRNILLVLLFQDVLWFYFCVIRLRAHARTWAQIECNQVKKKKET
jgi:hypothetical protein